MDRIASKLAAIASITGNTRSCSCCAVTGSAPGRVDSPPISKICAPSLMCFSADLSASSRLLINAPSEKESGVIFMIAMMMAFGPNVISLPCASCQIRGLKQEILERIDVNIRKFVPEHAKRQQICQQTSLYR